MRNFALIAVTCALIAVACSKGDGRPAGGDEAAAAETARPVGLVFPEASRAETLLKSAGIPIENRSDLTREFPGKCTWLAVYSSKDPEVILEAYAFADDATAREYGAERNAQLLAMDDMREFAVATNGALLLVAYYDPTEDAEAKKEALTKFVEAFAGEE
jgi:hypothetical protein